MSGTFTPQMRDRQARGKDPYHSADGSDNGDASDHDLRAGRKMRLGEGRSEKEDFASVERRQKAMAFLDNPELLMMYAQTTGDSIAGARLHFTKILCGYDDPVDEAAGLSTSRAPTHSHGRRDQQHSSSSAGRRRGGGSN